MWNTGVFFKPLNFFKSFNCICWCLHTISHVSSITRTPSTYPPPEKGQVSRVNGISDDDDGWSQSKWDWSGYNTSSRRRKAEGRKPQNEKQEGGERTERAMGVAERKTELETTFCCCRSLCPLWVTVKCYLVVICPDGVTTDLFSRKHTLKREWLPFFKAFSSTSSQWLDPSLSKAPV